MRDHVCFALGYLSGALTALLAVAVGILLSGCGPDSLGNAYRGARDLACSQLQCPQPGNISCARDGDHRVVHCSVRYDNLRVSNRVLHEEWRWEEANAWKRLCGKWDAIRPYLTETILERYTDVAPIDCNEHGGCWFSHGGSLMDGYPMKALDHLTAAVWTLVFVTVLQTLMSASDLQKEVRHSVFNLAMHVNDVSRKLEDGYSRVRVVGWPDRETLQTYDVIGCGCAR